MPLSALSAITAFGVPGLLCGRERWGWVLLSLSCSRTAASLPIACAVPSWPYGACLRIALTMESADHPTTSSACRITSAEVRSAPRGLTAMTGFGLANPFRAISISSFIHLLLLACTPATTSTVPHGSIFCVIARFSAALLPGTSRGFHGGSPP